MKLTLNQVLSLDYTYRKLLDEPTASIKLRIILIKSIKKTSSEIDCFRKASDDLPKKVEEYRNEIESLTQKFGEPSNGYLRIPDKKIAEFETKQKELEKRFPKEHKKYIKYVEEINEILEKPFEITLPEIPEKELEKLDSKLVRTDLLSLLINCNLLIE
jgi:hypothetical protein